ncbi:MAG: DUF2096 family protein [Candidatus Thorarchaeota archaeon]|nr:MAG: DUF2096 family protein [Candidatus Thorarchaeota archaeon]
MVSIEGLYAAWQVLNDLLGELREKDVFIPNMTYADLRNSKMVLEYLRSFEEDIQPSDPDQRLWTEMETKMHSLRETLMVWAEEKDGEDYRQSWEERFKKALHEKTSTAPVEHKVAISDIPREKDVGFFRIRLPEETPVEIVSEIAEECGVLISLDGERHLQVSGKRDCVRDAMKKLGEAFYGQSKLT